MTNRIKVGRDCWPIKNDSTSRKGNRVKVIITRSALVFLWLAFTGVAIVNGLMTADYVLALAK